ncbi:hypothetical protein ASD77_00935 [Pseudoxanthomonas sp. Root65]|uniref:hypothetical protein n=1 Tax=Pseudoxanthomonas sp. Root65 TaxID=1736576 RepID=UPI0006F9B5E5|nr:hypothetical protein [Pseudoxanthomonas sp. Root65]KRA53293.1 hypothetical protein ASD77_00935 [Pseudoxanthomonas sp. Root65]
MTHVSTSYAIGQRWRCLGRHAAETPVLTINRIDQHPLGGEILHVSVTNAHIRHPGLRNGVITTFAHLPIIGQVLERSDAELVGQGMPDPAYLDGYHQWKQAFDAGHAGSYGIPLAEILDLIEMMLAKRDTGH